MLEVASGGRGWSRWDLRRWRVDVGGLGDGGVDGGVRVVEDEVGEIGDEL